MSLHVLFESVADIWLIWLLGMVASSVAIYRALSQLRWKTFGGWSRDESGASYTMSYVLTFPIYLLLICVMIQSTLILLVKIGNVYATYAAARAAVVWQSSDPEDPEKGLKNARFHAGRAAILAMAPFASGYSSHREQLYPMFPARLDADNPLPLESLMSLIPDRYAYESLYQRLGERNVRRASGATTSRVIKSPDALAQASYVRNKYLYAAAATKVKFSDEVAGWNQDLTVTVTHRMPMHIPGAGRILGTSSGSWFSSKVFYRDISTTVTLPSEAPQTDTKRLNIPYDPAFFSRYLGN